VVAAEDEVVMAAEAEDEEEVVMAAAVEAVTEAQEAAVVEVMAAAEDATNKSSNSTIAKAYKTGLRNVGVRFIVIRIYFWILGVK
jgi:hypothetical protein